MTENRHPTTSPTEIPVLVSTMQIDPEAYSPQTAGNRVQATLYAVAGLLYLLRREKSFRWVIAASFISMALALWLQIEKALLIELLIVIGLVWVTESLNTAVEAAVDVATPDFHPMAKVSKDVAAAATLIASMLAIIVASLILLPPLAERLL